MNLILIRIYFISYDYDSGPIFFFYLIFPFSFSFGGNTKVDCPLKFSEAAGSGETEKWRRTMAHPLWDPWVEPTST